jgi:hypothetical protein
LARFYDNVIEHGIATPRGYAGISEKIWPEMTSATIVDMSNVARYFYAGTDQEDWLVARDFPAIRSPFETAWYEYSHSGFVASAVHGNHWEQPITIGFLCRVFERGDYIDALHEDDPIESFKRQYDIDIRPRWIQEMLLFVSSGKGKPARGPLAGWRFPIQDDGACCQGNEGEAAYQVTQMALGDEEDPARRMAFLGVVEPIIYPALLGISFMHCRNVKRIEHSTPQKIQRRRERSKRPPVSRYYTLEIDALKEDVQHEGGMKSGGMKRAIAKRRGHFKTYTEERPLFGKQVGRWFWTEQMVGNPSAGRVKKDYAVKRGA